MPWKTQNFYSPLYFKDGEGNGNPLQYSCLENPKGRGAWWAAVHGVAESRTRLSDFTLTFHFHALEKEMADHSSVLAWRIPGMGEPGGLPSLGSHRVGHDWSDLAAAVLERHSVSYLTMWVLRETGWRASERVTCVGLWEKDPTFYPITRLNPLYGKQKNLPRELEDPNAERMESLFSFQKLCRMSYDNMGPSLE